MESETGQADEGKARRRARQPGTVRGRRIAIAVDEPERADLEDAARVEGLTVSAFVAGTALGAARQTAPVDTDVARDALAGLARATVQVQKAGTNLNQAVAALNATGQSPGNLVACARYVTEVIRRLDGYAARVARLLP
ncbi:MAG: plasmid mobilization relaxosome protein MobC [Streptosporangiaceae bacterium]|jgi:uncharacterized protein (DUF1778 family)